MINLRVASIIFITLLVSYSLLVHKSINFEKNVALSPCKVRILQSLTSWDSGCFYKALFQKETTYPEIYYEKLKLDNFNKKRGVNPNTLRYQAYFSREFKDILKYTNDDIDLFYWKHQQAAPHKLEELIQYIQYLNKNERAPHTQTTFDRFCHRYVKEGLRGIIIVKSLDFELNKNNLTMDFSKCLSYLGEDRPVIQSSNGNMIN